MRIRTLLLVATALTPLTAHAGPDGAQVVGGSATVTGQGGAHVIVNQATDKAIINWRLFDIGVGQRATFQQPNSGSITLNRVTGGMGPSQILGSLDANGKVFIINRDGIIFGAGAVINTAGFLATTSDIRNEDFMAGRYNFQIPGRPDASIVNAGTITAANGGFAALVAPGVRNSGTITATLGTVGLAAGNSFTLDFYGDKLITLGVGDQIAGDVKDVATGKTLKSLVTNQGKLSANGGRVELTAAAARQVVDSVINTSGVIEANAVSTKGGQIVLSAGTASSKAAGSAKQTVRVGGTLSASGKQAGTKGGKIVVTGENIEVAGATIDASGRDGGGTVMIGGDWGGGKPDKSLVNNQSATLDAATIPNATTVSVDAATHIDASAKDRGDGGKVILWADGRLSFAGTILALGGQEFGNGGFVETSGKGGVDISGTMNGGVGGTWLLDPPDVIVDAPLAASANAALNAGTNFTITTLTTGGGNGDILVNTQIAWNTSATLTLVAFRDIRLPDLGINANIRNFDGAAGKLVMRADSTGTGTGTIVMPFSTFNNRVVWTGSTGSIAVYYNPTVFGTQDNFVTPPAAGHFTLASPSQLTQYMLVNNATNLQAIGTNASTLGENYALGPANLNMTGFPFLPIGYSSFQFTGRFDGLGNTISNLTIAPVAPAAFGVSIGLFSAIGATGQVSNLNITNASVTANPNVTGPGQFIGILAGSNGGTISNVTVSGAVSSGAINNGIVAGGLVGQNGIFGPGASMGAITLSNAAAIVTVGNSTTGSQNNNAGGLVGGNPGSITLSGATGNVSGGTNSFIGGLVGRNDGTISLAATSGTVTLGDTTGSGAGGLVGFNFGAISSSGATGNVTAGASSNIFTAGNVGGFVGINSTGAQIIGGVAGGNVNVGLRNTAGGFAGSNSGFITGSGAIGTVTAVDNSAGGFVGFNNSSGTITASTAIGNVTSAGHTVGGFVGDNMGAISGSTATGVVTATTALNSDAGGFAGNNNGTIANSQAFGNVIGSDSAGGFVASNDDGASITNSYAFGSVTIGNNAAAGGFASANFGTIGGSAASGAVTGGNNTILAGFVAGNFGTINTSTATGNVSSTGPNSIVGGFAGVSFDLIANSTATGAVNGTSQSYLGGFVGINAAKIGDSTSSGNVTGSGGQNFVGGFAGVNFGFIDPSFSFGNASSGPNSVVGGFVGANAALQFPDGFQVIGTVSPDSGGSGTATGGPGSTVGQQVGVEYPTGGLPDLPGRTCDGHSGTMICGGTLFNPGGSQGGDHHHQDQNNIPQISPLLNIAATLVSNTTQDPPASGEVVSTQGAGGTGGGSSPPGQKGGGVPGDAGRPPSTQIPPAGLGPLPSGMPPINETRFASNEVVMQLGLNLTPEQIADLARRFGLEVISSQAFGLIGRTVYRFRIIGGLGVRDVIAGIQQAIGARVSVQPSYTFHLPQASGGTAEQSSSTQYIIDKLNLKAAHAIATGKGVKIAVIDSEIDAQHPDLQGVIAATYDALPSTDQTPHPHGTGMAGAIASHTRLRGIAPEAKLLAIRAFSVNSSGPQGTSMNIVKGLAWAINEGAQIINMSFAGPRDPLLEQTIAGIVRDSAKNGKPVILIAAAGNMGAKSPPLFPAADKNVIAVSATDTDDKTYKNANRGNHIAIAAPGVDILVPAPDGGYQLTTGTSVAAAHISGVAALLLERDKNLTAADVRAILKATAKKLPQGRNEIGDGLVDPVQALSKAGPKLTAR